MPTQLTTIFLMKKIILLIALSFISKELFADFISLIQADKCETILEVFINEKNIVVKLEIGEEDYQWFSDVIPQDYFKGGFDAPKQKERWKHFMQQQFVLQTGNRNLAGKIKLVEQRNRIPRASLYTGQADSTLLNKKIIYVEIEYPLRSKSSQISITPGIQEGYQTTLANIGFIVYHKAIPVNDLRYLGVKETLYLDWEDPWYSYFENKNIKRHHSSSFMSFLYVEPYEVRHEILGRIKDLEGWID